MSLFLLTTVLSIALVFSGQITEEAKNLGSLPELTLKEFVKPTEFPTEAPKAPPTPVISQQERQESEDKKVVAYNTSSEKTLPAEVPQKAIDNSPALENVPTPTATPSITPSPSPTPTEVHEPKKPSITPFPCSPDFERRTPRLEMPCIY